MPAITTETTLSFDFASMDTLDKQLDTLLKKHQHTLDTFLESHPTPTYDQLVPLLEALDNELHLFWAPIGHLNAVKNSEPLRKSHEACLPLLSAYGTWLEHHQGLFKATQHIAHTAEFEKLTPTQKKYITDSLRDFKLAGVALSPQKKKKVADISSRLSKLANTFEQNIMDASDAWTLLIKEKENLKGLPEHALSMLAEEAAQHKEMGYLLTLHAPCYLAIMTYAENRALREKMYHAWITKASELGPQGGQFDNSKVLFEIVGLKQKLAKLLGFKNYSEYSLLTKMAKKPETVMAFLEKLLKLAKPFAEKEMTLLTSFAKTLGIDELAPWDIAYVSEKLKMQQWHFEEEQLRPYFPISTVLKGLFEINRRLFGLHIEPTTLLPAWHSDVQAYVIKNAEKETVAYFYLDLYARNKKRGGAWMDDAQTYWRTKDIDQKPIAFLTCNFSPPLPGQEALLTHEEVVTLFHEFGHGLHHMLTEVSVMALTGTHVEWDAVELPSQWLENFCWDPSCLRLLTRHVETQESIPEVLLQQLLKSKHFLSGMFLMRQLEFAIFDLRLYWKFDPRKGAKQIQTCLDQVRKEVSVIPVAPYNRFQHSFSHIFGGGYASGYYSYLWAEVLAQDAFAFFEEKGLLSQEAGAHFRKHILSQGGAQDAADLFRNFRGRDPEIAPLLKGYGLYETTQH